MGYNDRVPDAVARRLPGYYRKLLELEAEGFSRISSQTLGKLMGQTASQIRQDMNFFGGFGQQGYGYNVPALKNTVGQILGIGAPQHAVIVGAGNIGSAVARYPSFRDDGFLIDALFDINPAGRSVAGIPVLPAGELPGYLAEHTVGILIIATPADSAQAVLDIAASAKVPGVWNFAPVDLTAPDWMEVSNVHLADSLMALSFRMHEREVLRQRERRWVRADENAGDCGRYRR